MTRGKLKKKVRKWCANDGDASIGCNYNYAERWSLILMLNLIIYKECISILNRTNIQGII